MNKSRTSLALKNTLVTTVVTFFNFPIQFINRYFMVRYLGITYLGLTSLFSNILSVLSLADLGIGSAIIFLLYKPLATRDFEKVSVIMKYYRRIYQYICGIIFLLGILIIPFLHVFVGEKITYPHVYLLFVIYLLGAASSYLFSYNQSLLYADQKSYVISWLNLLVTYVMLALQIITVITLKNPLIYATLFVFSGFITNLLVTIYVNRKYKFNKHIKKKLSSSEKKSLVHNVIGNMFMRVSGVVVTATDNIFLSAFVGVDIVGIYANYVTIINVIQKIITQVINSVAGSIGNYIVQKEKSESKRLFFNLQFINFLMVSMAFLGILFLSDDVITWWLGSKYIIDKWDVFLIALSFYVMNYRIVGWNFISVYGLAKYMKLFSTTEMLANVVFTLIFLTMFKLKLAGVILGTVCSTILTVAWQDPYVIFHHAFDSSVKEYTLKYIYNIIILVADTFVTKGMISVIDNISLNLIISIALKAILIIIISIVIPYILYIKSYEVKYLNNLVFRIIRGTRQ